MNGLSNREEQIVKLILRGYTTNQEIYEYLMASEGRSPRVKTIGLHLNSVYKKLGFSDRVKLVLWAVRLGYPVTWEVT